MILYGQMDPSPEFKNKFMVKFLQSLSQKHKGLSHGNTLLQAMGQLLSLVANCHNSCRIGGKAKALVLAKVMNKGDGRIIVQSSNDFSKATEQL